MRVELSKAMNILAHELRGPLGVIQGYVRLLRQQHADKESGERMLVAIQEASSRLATLGRQATDISQWCENDAPPARAGEPPATVERLLHAIRDSLPADRLRLIPEPDGVSDARLAAVDGQALGAAVVTLVEAAARDAVGRPVRVTTDMSPGFVTLTITPDAPPDDSTPPSVSKRTPTFERGGLGLSLVLASHVLAAHEAEVAPADSTDGITLRLRIAEGRS